MRYVMIFGLVILAFFFHCGDAKAEAPDNIYFVTLDEVKAKMAAKELDMIYVDTGAMYRAIAIWVLDEGIAPDDEKSISRDLDNLNVLDQ